MQPLARRAPAIAEGLMTDEAEPRLVGGRDLESGRTVFPCPPGGRFEAVPLPREGRVWSWTVQRFRPKSPPYGGPDGFEPFILAYVELETVIVAARLIGTAPEAVRIGMPVRFAPAPFARADGTIALVPAFVPTDAPE